MRSRLAFVLAALPFLAYAWACSSDPESPPAVDEDSGLPDRDGDDGDSGGGDPDSGDPDGGDAGPTCVGNPLTMDGMGMGVDAGTAQLITPLGVATFYDGPQWVPVGAGNVYFSDFNASTLLRIAPNGGTPQNVRGINNAIGNALRDGVVLTAGAGNIFSTLSDGGTGPNAATAPAVDPNDLVVGPGGNLYFTDPRYQTGGAPTGLYRMTPAGAVSSVKAFGTAAVNGIAFFAPTLTLYVGVTAPKSVVKYTVAIDGSVSPASEMPFLMAAGLIDSPDGIAVDVGGNVWVTEANATFAVQSGRVEVFNPTGQKLGEIPFPTARPTGIAFGGADGKTAYITTQLGVYSFRSRCAGVQ
jgi:sugar lactone lactonase YvrE